MPHRWFDFRHLRRQFFTEWANLKIFSTLWVAIEEIFTLEAKLQIAVNFKEIKVQFFLLLLC